MILIWRGWGLLALVALFPLLASCAGLITVEPLWIFMLAAGASLLAAGVICVYYGARWNRHATEHSLYYVPLETWGFIYLALFVFLAFLLALAAIAGAIKQGLDKPGRLIQAIAGGVGLLVTPCVGYLLLRFTRAQAKAGNAVKGDAIEYGPETDARRDRLE